MGIGLTEFLVFIVPAAIGGWTVWTVSKRRNQQGKQQKKPVGLVLAGALVGAIGVFVLYALLHHP
jgi:ABC-type spermidine/putrescine transport system permease subunit I